MSRLRAAVIGLGVGRRHIAGFRAHAHCEVVAACDLSEQALAETKREFPEIKTLTRQAQDVLADPTIDVVSIATYDDCHSAQTSEALRRGKHVFVEKPLCLRPDEAAEIRGLLTARPQLRLSSNLILRMSPRFRRLKHDIVEGRMGRVYSLDGDYNYGRLHKITDGWRGRIPYYSVVYGGAVHLIDLMRWLIGDEVEAVSACGNQIASAGSQYKFNDCVAALLRFRGGAIAKVTSNYGCVMPHFHALTVYGTKATFVNGMDTAVLFEQADGGQKASTLTEPYPGVDKSELAYNFIDAIAGGGPQAVTADDVFNTMAVCFAVEQAATRNDWVTVKGL